MVFVRNSRNPLGGFPYRVAALCLAIVALLFVRFARPTFSEIPSAQATVASHLAHHPRSCFDHDGQGWSVPVAFLAMVPPEVSHQLPSVSKLILPFQTKGSHYNRPPPLS
jgi:hypothetical protein